LAKNLSSEERMRRAARVRRLALWSWLLWMVGTPVLVLTAGQFPLTRWVVIAGWAFMAACFVANAYYAIRILASGGWRHK
jgi:hypothetical protein